jgi:chromate transporter
MNISLREQWKIWSYVAAHSFGGPAGQIAVIHKIIVEDKKLISEERFLHALNFCMLLPGPEAQQLATYMGWLMNKWRGGLLAGGLFILPGFLSILLLSYLYVIFNETLLVQGLFYGVKPAVIAMVAAALYRISRKSLSSRFHWSIAILAFVSLFFFNLSFPFVVITSGILGVICGKFNSTASSLELSQTPHPTIVQTARTLMAWMSVWVAPMILTLLIFGADSTFHALNIFFSKMSMVTFGGAYAALSYVAQKAVEVYGWLGPNEMLDGLAMAESTPGPLIQSVQFVGFMGAWRFPDLSSPLLAAFIGSALTTWMTFAPCFLWIFTLAPYVEFIRGQRSLNNALRAISAAVVGVIFNLSLWFAINTLFTQTHQVKIMPIDLEYPVLTSVDFYSIALCALALVMQFKFKRNLFEILGFCTLVGVILKLAF